MKNQKYIFLWALIATAIIFCIGIFFGYALEASRISIIDYLYLQSEKQILSQNTQNVSLNDCGKLTENNIKFGDQIYNDALTIQRYEGANELTDRIAEEHRKYDLLRALFWTDSIKIKNSCNSSYHDVVYLYDFNAPSVVQSSMQVFFSNVLYELKQKYGNKIMLIPIAGDNNLSSVDLLMKKYNVTEMPTILIDEKTRITQINSKEDIEKYLN